MVNHVIKVLSSDQLFTLDYFQRIDWPTWSTQVVNDGLTSLIYPRIKHIYTSLPPDAVQFFHTYYENAVIFKDFAVQVLKDLQPSLSSIGTIVIMQGLALSETVYPEPQCRAMGDVDLFLPDKNMKAVREVFLDYGFTRYRNYENVLEYNQLMIDLHEGLWGTDRFKQREFIVPLRKVTWQPSTLIPGLYVLHPEHLALHCAFHGVKHGFNKGVWDCDLIRLFNAGYLTPIAQGREEYVLKYITFKHLRNRKLLPVSMGEDKNYPIPPVVKAAVTVLVSRCNRPGFGQMLLAFLCPSLKAWLSYFKVILMPPKRILEQMYGRLPYLFLIFRRVWDLLRYVGKACKRWR